MQDQSCTSSTSSTNTTSSTTRLKQNSAERGNTKRQGEGISMRRRRRRRPIRSFSIGTAATIALWLASLAAASEASTSITSTTSSNTTTTTLSNTTTDATTNATAAQISNDGETVSLVQEKVPRANNRTTASTLISSLPLIKEKKYPEEKDVAPSTSNGHNMQEELLLLSNPEHRHRPQSAPIRAATSVKPKGTEETIAQQQQKGEAETEEDIRLREKENHQFMDWCKQVLGIQTSLEIHTFYYYDYMTAAMTQPSKNDNDDDSDDGDDDDDNIMFDDPAAKQDSTIRDSNEEEWQDPPTIPVRGLRATRYIEQGEVVISIPFQALVTVGTTIDQDPVLSRVIGPEARQKYGWTLEQAEEEQQQLDGEPINNDSDTASVEAVDFFELPLLAVALLHHYKLGTSSPMYPYIHVLRRSPLDSVPFLWNKEERQTRYYPHDKNANEDNNRRATITDSNKGIQTVARSIRLEMKEMYHTVIDTLVRDHPDLFGKKDPTGSANAEGHEQYDIMDGDDWAFSFENFQWAFAMVNSRHWLLPIADLESSTSRYPAPPAESPPSASMMLMQPQGGSTDGVPPAEMPTDAWLDIQKEKETDGDDDEHDQNETNNSEEEKQRKLQEQQQPPLLKRKSSLYHSFLAPVADLLNFGPPCTRGRYNPDSHTFDIIASCNFNPGQEVTFWYSDECEDVVIGNYGFTHPMVPKCPTAEDLRMSRDKYKIRASILEEALENAYEDLDVLDTHLDHVQQILANCDCCDIKAASSAIRQQEQQQDIQQEEQQQQQQQHQGTSNKNSGLHANNLRNPSSQIRGGGGTMMSVDGVAHEERRGNSDTGRSRARKDRESRSRNSSRGRGGGSTDNDDVERHGVRRMWGSAL